MGIVRRTLKAMKVENPEEYKALMKGYDSEDALVREVLGLSAKALSHYETMKRGVIK